MDEPDRARPLDGVPALLERLADRYAVVAVVSGRPVAFLQQWLPAAIVLSGLYGLEVVHNGVRREHPSAEGWRAMIDDVTAVARQTGPL